jgi:hypothetical protein
MFAFGLIPLAMIPAYLYKKRADEADRVRGHVQERDDEYVTIRIPYQSTASSLGDVLDAFSAYGTVVHMYDDMDRETVVYRCRFECPEDYEELLRDDTFRFEVAAAKDEAIMAATVSG